MNDLSACLRADVSNAIGFGHLSRAVAMGRTLERAGVKATVYCRRFGPDSGRISSKIEFHRDIIREISGEDEFIRAVRGENPSLLFVDLLEGPDYAPNVVRYAELCRGRISVCFDSFYDDRIPFRLHIGPTFDGTVSRATGISGLRYFVFPEELRELAPRKTSWSGARRCLITLGGSDPHAKTSVIARSLCGSFPSIHFTAVVGPGFSAQARKSLAEAITVEKNLVVAVEPEHLGRLYLDNDVAIVSGGQTKFEAALFGLPSLLVTNTESEEILGRRFSEMGLSVFAGRAADLTADTIRAQFSGFLDDSSALEKMSARGRSSLDIHGGERVLEHIWKNLS